MYNRYLHSKAESSPSDHILLLQLSEHLHIGCAPHLCRAFLIVDLCSNSSHFYRLLDRTCKEWYRSCDSPVHLVVKKPQVLCRHNFCAHCLIVSPPAICTWIHIPKSAWWTLASSPVSSFYRFSSLPFPQLMLRQLSPVVRALLTSYIEKTAIAQGHIWSAI